MAYLITQQCNACAACAAVCPNSAIGEGPLGIYRINHFYCTECLGYAEEPSCASVCALDAIVDEAEFRCSGA